MKNWIAILKGLLFFIFISSCVHSNKLINSDRKVLPDIDSALKSEVNNVDKELDERILICNNWDCVESNDSLWGGYSLTPDDYGRLFGMDWEELPDNMFHLVSSKFQKMENRDPIIRYEWTNQNCTTFFDKWKSPWLSERYCHFEDTSFLKTLYDWVSIYNPLDAEIEIGNMIKSTNLSFFYLPNLQIADSLIESYTRYPFLIDYQNPDYLIKWFTEFKTSETQHFFESQKYRLWDYQRQCESIADEIWDDRYFQLNLNKSFIPSAEFLLKPINKKYSQFYESIYNDYKGDSLPDYKSFHNALNLIENCPNDWKKIESYFVLSCTIIKTGKKDSAYLPLNKIYGILSSNNSLSKKEIIQSYIGLAKFYATINFRNNYKSIYTCLKIASAKSDYESKLDYQFRINCLRAMFWLEMNTSTGTNFAINNLGRLYSEIPKNDYQRKIKILSYLSTALCQLHLNYKREVRGYIPSDILVLRMASYAAILNDCLAHGIMPEYTMSGLSTLSYFYNITGRPKHALRCLYTELEYLKYFPKKNYSDIFNCIEQIYNSHVEVKDNVNALKWAKACYNLHDEEATRIKELYPHYVNNLSDEQYNSVLDSIFKNSVVCISSNYPDPLAVKVFLDDMASRAGRFSDWEKAYKLIQKSDSIHYADNFDYLFDLGYSGASGDRYVEIRELELTKNSLNKKIEVLSITLQEKASRISTLDSQIQINTKKNSDLLVNNEQLSKTNNKLQLDSINLEKKNIALSTDYHQIMGLLKDTRLVAAVFGVMLIFIVCLSVIFFRQKRKATKLKSIAEEEKKRAFDQMHRAETSEAREKLLSRTMSQLGHLAPDIQWLLAAKLKKYNLFIADQVKTLGTKLREIYLSSSKQSNVSSFENEIRLALELMQIRYQDDYSQASKLTILENPQLLKVGVPPMIIFNLISNAYKHGQIAQMDKFGNYGKLRITGELTDGYWKMAFENDSPPPKEEDSEAGTGLAFVKFILKEWNGNMIPENFKPDLHKAESGAWKYSIKFNLKNETIHAVVG